VIRPAGMIWHIAGHRISPLLMSRSEQPARVLVLTPRPGLLFCSGFSRRSSSSVSSFLLGQRRKSYACVT
jgi:hypothetical protein